MSLESTRLIPPKIGDEREPEVRSESLSSGSVGRGREEAPSALNASVSPQLPRRSCLFRTFLLIRIISTIITTVFVLSQVGLWALVPGIAVQKILRAYLILFGIMLVAAEWNVKVLPDFLSPSNNEAYKNWFYRGFQYSFIGVIGLEESYATLGHNYPDNPGWSQVAVAALLKGSAIAIIAMGVLYMAMRLLFLNKLWERADARYRQELEELRRQQSV